MTRRMAKFYCTVLIFLVINVCDIFVKGQSTTRDCNNDKQDIYSGLWRICRDMNINNCDALTTLTKNIQSEFHNLKAQISGLEKRDERHETYLNYSIEEIRRQIQTANNVTKAQISRLEIRVERHDTNLSHTLQEDRREMQMKNTEMKNEIQRLNKKLSGVRCPVGFNYSVAELSKCYAVLSERVDWNTAQQKCRQLHINAQLIVINDSREAQITSEILQDHDCEIQNRFPDNGTLTINGFWIGARRSNISDCKSPLQWINGRQTVSMQYNNWDFLEPNCFGQGEACAAIEKKRSFKWNDVMCTWSACPVCEVIGRTSIY